MRPPILSKKVKDWWIGGFSAEAQAVFDLMNTDPPPVLKSIMATFIDSQVASGNWAIMLPYQFILYGMDTAANSVVNWMNVNFNAVNAGSPHVPWSGAAHSGFAGFSPDGATLYVNSGVAPSDVDIDDVRCGVWMHTNDNAGANVLFGARDAANTDDFFFQQQPVLNLRYKLNANNTTDFAEAGGVFNDNTFYELVRPDSANQKAFINGAEAATEAVASEAVGTRHFYDGGFNLQGALSLPLDCNITARLTIPNTGFNAPNFYSNLLIMLQSMGIEA